MRLPSPVTVRPVRSRLGAFALSLGAFALLTAASLGGAAAAPPAPGPYTGNVQSGIFHAPTCRYFDCKACKALFKTKAEALAAGYRPCMVCRP